MDGVAAFFAPITVAHTTLGCAALDQVKETTFSKAAWRKDFFLIIIRR